MKHQIIGDNIEITEGIKELIREHLLEPIDDLLRNFEDDIKFPTIKVFKKAKPGPPGYEINFDMWLPGKFHVFAKEEDRVMIKCVTKLREDVERQIKEYRDKIMPHAE